ncbi:5-oxoprolinase subunit PxpB [Microbulbifer epialgicus]|uniref:5-oxoprolinase subunit PxpB n=1 Tax=Microbulbifer epialgicus TaxID=393907 RepID=A0ABV4NWM7_9GAMM
MTSHVHTPNPKKPSFEIVTNGDSALDIRFFSEPSEQLSRYIIGLRQYILKQSLTNIIDLIPAYQCLTISFDSLQPGSESLSYKLNKLTHDFLENPVEIDRRPRLIRIPVCYEEEFAPDMQLLSEYTKLSRKEIISLHTSNSYLVHMLGFTPGFLYLGGLDIKLHCPRKKSPRLRVPAGAVGIGGNQTGIYPQATPGGWQIIGQTPFKLFQPSSSSPFIADPLDVIKFYAIEKRDFADFTL